MDLGQKPMVFHGLGLFGQIWSEQMVLDFWSSLISVS